MAKMIDKKGKKSLQQHLECYSITVDVSNAGDVPKMKTQNHAIAYKTHKYLQEALAKLERLSDVDAEQIIAARCDVTDKNTRSKQGDLWLRQDMIKAAVDSNDQASITQLITYAMEKNEPELLIELLSLGANLHQAVPPSSWDMDRKITPVGWAISKGDTILVKQLLATAPDKTRDSLGIPYLHQAIARYSICPNTLDMVSLLVEHGADINAKSTSGNTVLHNFSMGYNHDISIFEKLIALGANVNEQDDSLNTPLHYARTPDLVGVLIRENANVNVKNKLGQTPLHQCADAAAELIQAGADVTERDNEENTPLHYAKSESGVTAMMDAGAQINAENKHGNTPLHTAISNEVTTALIAHGAKIDSKNHKGITALSYLLSSCMDQKKMEHGLFLFIKAGADVSNLDTVIVSNLNKSLEKYVFEAIDEGDGKSLMHLLKFRDQIRRQIKRVSSKISNVNLLDAAIQLNQPGIIQLLVNFKNALGRAPLAEILDIEKIKKYIAAGANVNDMEEELLTNALCHDNNDALYIFLEAGTNVNATNKEGETALHELKNNFKDYENPDEKIKTLLFYGADASCLDSSYLTHERLFDYFSEAIQTNNTRALEHLLTLRESRGSTLSLLVSNEALVTASEGVNNDVTLQLAQLFKPSKIEPIIDNIHQFSAFIKIEPSNTTRIKEALQKIKTSDEPDGQDDQRRKHLDS